MRALIMSAAFVFAAGVAMAQDPLSAAKKAAQNAASATNAHTETMQRPEATAPQQKVAPQQKAAPQQKSAEQKSAPTQPKAAAPQQKTAAAPQAKTQTTPKNAPPAGQPAKATVMPQAAVTAPDTAGPPPSIMRESFDYAKEGRRDPFVSLLTTSELRPTMSDLRLTSIIYDQSGRNSLATLRDQSANSRYTVHVGSTLGRMRVAAIRPLTVLLTIDEFGATRQDSLILRDSTKVRRP